jgi:hypothetical protein
MLKKYPLPCWSSAFGEVGRSQAPFVIVWSKLSKWFFQYNCTNFTLFHISGSSTATWVVSSSVITYNGFLAIFFCFIYITSSKFCPDPLTNMVFCNKNTFIYLNQMENKRENTLLVMHYTRKKKQELSNNISSFHPEQFWSKTFNNFSLIMKYSHDQRLWIREALFTHGSSPTYLIF